MPIRERYNFTGEIYRSLKRWNSTTATTIQQHWKKKTDQKSTSQREKMKSESSAKNKRRKVGESGMTEIETETKNWVDSIIHINLKAGEVAVWTGSVRKFYTKSVIKSISSSILFHPPFSPSTYLFICFIRLAAHLPNNPLIHSALSRPKKPKILFYLGIRLNNI